MKIFGKSIRESRPLKAHLGPQKRAWMYLAAGIAALVLPGLSGGLLTRSHPTLPHLREARNPATIFRSATWYEAYDSDESTPISSYGHVLFGRPHGQKVCSLTFDDGPHPLCTPELVATLKRLKVPATFFVIGKQVDRYPSLIQLEAENGFAIGNHSYSHVTLTHLDNHELLTEFKACDMAIAAAGGPQPKFCRPPGGDVSWLTVRAAQTFGMAVALWSDDPGDYAIKSSAAISRDVIKGIKDNSIILLHDGNMATVKALPSIVNWARSHGYRFVPLSEMPSTRI